MVTFSELQELEHAALDLITREGVFHRVNSLVNAAHKARFVVGQRYPVNVHLSFTLPTRLREDHGHNAIERDFHVGCFASRVKDRDEIQSLTYSVLIGQDEHPSLQVARKFHFDFEPILQRNAAEPKPSFHMQMCGELSDHHEKHGYTGTHIQHLLPAWSKPRIPMQPMSLALVLNWLFIEFGTEAQVQNLRVNGKWRKLVHEAERKVLKPYYERCASFFGSHANNDLSFFLAQLYEK